MKALFLIFISISSFMFSQKNIEWNQKNRLSFDDFIGEPEISSAAAASAINIEYEIISQSIWTGKIKIKIKANFNKEKSWAKPEFKNLQLLAHEQGHFDIAQIFAIYMQRKVNNEIKTSQDFHKKFQIVYDQIYNEYFEFQNKYEIDTNHGSDVPKQDEYDTMIKEKLNDLLQ
ncbi:hypothetical protein [Chryseobacterium piscium]|nr:hypothetical protein [Chryseobacterium piscium]